MVFNTLPSSSLHLFFHLIRKHIMMCLLSVRLLFLSGKTAGGKPDSYFCSSLRNLQRRTSAFSSFFPPVFSNVYFKDDIQCICNILMGIADCFALQNTGFPLEKPSSVFRTQPAARRIFYRAFHLL